jgi:hypothetical protein
VLIVAVMLVGDNPALFRRYRQQTVTLDRAVANEEEIRTILEKMLNARVHVVHVQKLDLVDDTTVVDVRYELNKSDNTDHSGANDRSSALAAQQFALEDSPSAYASVRS